MCAILRKSLIANRIQKYIVITDEYKFNLKLEGEKDQF